MRITCILDSMGGGGAERVMTHLAGGLANFAACLAIIPRFGVAGAAMAFILTYLVLLFWLWRVKDAYLSRLAQ